MPENRLTGRVAIFARATQNLSRFNLDFRDFYAISRLTVNLKRASFSQSGQELTITPRSKLRRGQRVRRHRRIRRAAAGDRRPGRVERGLDPDR